MTRKTAARCSGRTKRGTRCASTVELRQVGTRWFCVAHDPKRKASRESRRRAAVTPVPVTPEWPLPHDKMPVTAEECRIVGSWAMRELAFGRMEKGTAHEISSLVRATLKAIQDDAGATDAQAFRAFLEEMQAIGTGESKLGPVALKELGRELLRRKRSSNREDAVIEAPEEAPPLSADQIALDAILNERVIR